MASRPNSSVAYNQNRRMLSASDLERLRVFGSQLNGNSDIQASPLSTAYLNSGTNISSVPPPVPPRSDTSRYNRYSSYGGMYSPYNRFSPGMYSTGMYGGIRSPYSRFGIPPDSHNSFLQLAEESTRPAFESIESVVDIVGSISMMLESTYHAVYSSYNAILGVVDQFARLKDHLAEVLSFLALLRGLRYLCLKILYLLRLRKDNPSVEAAWKTATSSNPDFSSFSGDRKSPWPFFVFVGLVIGAPWLMFKLLARTVSKKPFDISLWRDSKGGYFTCYANYDFNSTRRGELSLKAGEGLFMAPKQFQSNAPRGWVLACNKDNKVGLIPSTYLKTQQSPSGNGALRVFVQRVPNPVGNASHAPLDNPANLQKKVGKLPEPTQSAPPDPFSAEEGIFSDILNNPLINEESGGTTEDQ